MATLFGLQGRMLRAVLISSLIAAVLTAGAVTLARPFFFAEELPAQLPVLIGVLAFITTIAVNAVYTFGESKRIKRRLDDVAAFAAVLTRGNLDYRMDVPRRDVTTRLVAEMNMLAKTMGKQVASLQRLADANKELADQVHSAAIIEERQRLARDLHDAVSQQLFALTMLSDAAVAAAAAGKSLPEGHVREIADLAAQIQQEMRALLLHLRPVQLHNETLAEGLTALVGELEQKSSLRFELTLQPLPPLPRGVENHLFRIVQEALANILRHAGAQNVKIHLFTKTGELFLQISDDGRGFDPAEEKKASYGLKTMGERCDEIGGKLSLTSRPGAGTRIDIRVPLAKGDGHAKDN